MFYKNYLIFCPNLVYNIVTFFEINIIIKKLKINSVWVKCIHHKLLVNLLNKKKCFF